MKYLATPTLIDGLSYHPGRYINPRFFCFPLFFCLVSRLDCVVDFFTQLHSVIFGWMTHIRQIGASSAPLEWRPCSLGIVTLKPCPPRNCWSHPHVSWLKMVKSCTNHPFLLVDPVVLCVTSSFFLRKRTTTWSHQVSNWPWTSCPPCCCHGYRRCLLMGL